MSRVHHPSSSYRLVSSTGMFRIALRTSRKRLNSSFALRASGSSVDFAAAYTTLAMLFSVDENANTAVGE